MLGVKYFCFRIVFLLWLALFTESQRMKKLFSSKATAGKLKNRSLLPALSKQLHSAEYPEPGIISLKTRE